MKWLIVVVAVSLVACAGSAPAPREYRQGVPVAPQAPTFNPITRSPITIGQSGYVGPLEGMPRSQGRVLPETPETRKESGLWAGEAPRAASNDEGDPSVILVQAPLAPPNANMHEIMRITQCALGTRDLLAHSAGNGSYEKSALTIKQLKQEGRCIVARVYRLCIGRVWNDEKGINKKRAEKEQQALPSLSRVDDLAQRFQDKECPFSDLPTAKLKMSERAEKVLNVTVRLFRNRYFRIVEEEGEQDD